MKETRSCGPAMRLVVLTCLALASALSAAAGETQQKIAIRGHEEVLHVYGARGGTPVIVSSGDGGWIHLGPHVAEVLSAHGFFVVGFDFKAYLAGFTSGATTLRSEDVPGDYRTLIEFASRGSDQKPLLIGVSEGAGLSVLAAMDESNKHMVAGVVGLGLCDLTELGWRWKDMMIYLTHGVPNEPTFSVKAIVDRLGPVPLAAIHSTRDEYVPLAEARDVLARAREPKRLWIVNAADHRFSSNLPEFDRSLIEAVGWITNHHTAIPQ